MQRKPSYIERALNPDQDDTSTGRSDTLSLHNTLGTRDSQTHHSPNEVQPASTSATASSVGAAVAAAWKPRWIAADTPATTEKRTGPAGGAPQTVRQATPAM